MADDVNKAGKGVNGKQLPKQLQEAIDERSRRISHDYLSNDDKYAAMLDREEKINGAQADIRNLLGKATTQGERDILAEQYQQSALLMDQTHKSMDDYESGNAGRQNSILADRIKTYTNSRNVNQRTTTMSGEQKFFRMANNSPDLYAPTDVLEQRISRGTETLTSLGSELSGRTRGIGTEDMPDSLMDKAARIQELQEDIALNKRMLKVQNKEGLSTEKRQYAASDTIDRVGEMLDTNALRADVRGGKYGSLQEETDKLGDLFSKLNEALGKFEEASENATDAQGNLTDEYKAASAELDKMQKDTDKQRKVVTEVERNGGGGSASNVVAESMPGLRRMVAAGYGMDIDDKITEMRLKAGTGQTAVDQFNRVNSGIGGDMRSLLRESTSQDFAKSFSDDMRQKALRQGIVDAAVAAPDAIMKGGAQFLDGDVSGGFTMGAGIMETVRGGMQSYRGLPQTAKALEAYKAGEQFSGVGLEIQAQGLQAVYDQQMLAYQASMGRGSSAMGTDVTLMDKFSLGKFAEQGMTPAMAANLTANASAAIGGTGSATGVAMQASMAQNTRIMSADQFVGMTGQLSNVGGTSNDLEEIMKNAVASGMDNAKNVQQMVSATVSLSSNMAKLGISGAGATGNLLGSMVQGMGGDKNISALAAESMLNIRGNMDSNSNINIGNVVEMGQLRKLDGKASTAELMRMSTLRPEEYQSIIEGGKDVAYKYGLEGVFDRGGKETFKEGSRIAARGSKVNAGLGIYTGAGDLGDGPLSSDARASLSMIGLDETGANLVAGRSVNKGSLNPVGGSGQDILKAQAQQQVKTFAYGAGDDVNTTLKQLVATMQDLSKMLSPEKAQSNVESSMNSMKVVGSLDKAGDKFTNATANFNAGVDKFNKLLEKSDMGEHRTRGNMYDNSSNGSQKANGRK